MQEKEQRERIKELVWEHCDWVVRLEDRNNAIEAGFDPVECEEMHLGGDCPLCGAK